MRWPSIRTIVIIALTLFGLASQVELYLLRERARYSREAYYHSWALIAQRRLNHVCGEFLHYATETNLEVLARDRVAHDERSERETKCREAWALGGDVVAEARP